MADIQKNVSTRWWYYRVLENAVVTVYRAPRLENWCSEFLDQLVPAAD